MLARVSVLALITSVAACSSPADMKQAAGAQAEDSPASVQGSPAAPPVQVTPQASAVPPSGNKEMALRASANAPDAQAKANPSAEAVKDRTDLYLFRYNYPAAAAAIPALAAALDRRAAAAKAELVTGAEKDRKVVEESGFPYNPHSFSQKWKVAADLPNWISLTGAFSSYAGGAHGNFGVTSLVWDKQAGKALRGVDLFISAPALNEAISQRYCKQLNLKRAQKSAAAQPDNAGPDAFAECPNVTELTVIPGSAGGRKFDRIGFYAGPYVAGSYAEGGYEVTLEMDKAMLGAVKPEFRSAFRAVR